MAGRSPSGTGEVGSIGVSITMVRPYQFDIIPGQSYELAGQLLPDGQEVGLHPLMLSGLGKITRVWDVDSNSVFGPTKELILLHDPNYDDFFSMWALDIPHETHFALNSRIVLAGRLENLGKNSGLVVVKVRRSPCNIMKKKQTNGIGGPATKGVHCEETKN
ncbi:hypothetical protein PSTT_14217 [Puccinia striiformis]|uniref:Uncharacterized protein n=1 Tax=Puccinia striiformis TaxID=27350 RepID=A0A2S4UN66_9BASI|nr:hypothetical protein PSTT_14217 [Puccinia striiformis]